ncbi:MAG TPA: hypothetical protein VL948_23490 [Verrucomicrobiae bacterium]|nr:hypothetical protein [Verrucomicrobiae bacterium]
MAHGLLPRFFERVTRSAFGDLALDDSRAAGYLTDLLTRYARAEALGAIDALPGRPLPTVADALLEIQRVWDWTDPRFAPEQERAVRRHVGDYTLFMLGLFRGHVERLAVTSYYETEGRRAYRFLAELGRAGHEPDAPLYARLAGGFERYAGALAYMKKVYFRDTALPWRGLAAS